MKKFFFERKFAFIDCIIFVVISTLTNIITAKMEGKCYNKEHAALVIATEKPKQLCETKEFKNLSREEQLKALEKKVLDDNTMHPVYFPSPDEMKLWELRSAQAALITLTNCIVCTDVVNSASDVHYAGDWHIAEVLEKRKAEWIREHGTNTRHKCSFGTNCVLNPWVPHD